MQELGRTKNKNPQATPFPLKTHSCTFAASLVYKSPLCWEFGIWIGPVQISWAELKYLKHLLIQSSWQAKLTIMCPLFAILASNLITLNSNIPHLSPYRPIYLAQSKCVIKSQVTSYSCYESIVTGRWARSIYVSYHDTIRNMWYLPLFLRLWSRNRSYCMMKTERV